MTREVKLTSQHQITIPKQVCDVLKLKGGDRLEISVLSDQKMVLRPKKLIDANDPAYRLGAEILEAESQIKRGEVTSWSDIKRRHRL